MIRIPIFLVLTGLLFSVANFTIDRAQDFFDVPPIRIIEGHLETAYAPAGGSIRVVLRVHRDRLCHTVAARYIHSPAGDAIQYSETVGGDAPIGTSRYSFLHPVPPGIAPGRYTFKGVVNSTCGTRRYVEVTPTLPFVVN